MLLVGLEPTTSGFEVLHSIQLSYRSIFIYKKRIDYKSILNKNGAGSGNRTHLFSLEGWSITDIRYLHKLGADEGSRTPTPKALDPKSSASANSATSALNLVAYWGIEPQTP